MREQRVGILNGSLIGPRPEKHFGSRAPDHSLIHKEVLGELSSPPARREGPQRDTDYGHSWRASLSCWHGVKTWEQLWVLNSVNLE